MYHCKNKVTSDSDTGEHSKRGVLLQQPSATPRHLITNLVTDNTLHLVQHVLVPPSFRLELMSQALNDTILLVTVWTQ